MDPEMVCASGLPKKDHERTVHTRDAGEVGGWVLRHLGPKEEYWYPDPPRGSLHMPGAQPIRPRSQGISEI